jgi:hypothetical protein
MEHRSWQRHNKQAVKNNNSYQLDMLCGHSRPLTEWISHVLGPVGVWALTGHVALHSEALQG